MHGYLGLVVPVRRDVELCVLKVSWLDESTAEEALALATWNGRGAAQLLALCPEQRALLLERLDHHRTLNDLDVMEAVTTAGHLLRRLAIPVPAGFRSLADVAQDLCRTLPQRWEQLGRPMPQRWMEQAYQAYAVAAHRGPASGRLLVNYDLHDADVLGGMREPWLAVDPKVVSGDLEFGVAQLLWRHLEDIESHGGLDRAIGLLVEAAALDATLARAWTLVRCVDYWLWALSVGLTEEPVRCVAIVTWLM